MINRVVAQKLIQEIPTTLRSAARTERQVIQAQTAIDPIGTSFRASHGQLGLVKNVELRQQIRQLISQLFAKDAYTAENFVQRQPIGTASIANAKPVIHASTFLG